MKSTLFGLVRGLEGVSRDQPRDQQAVRRRYVRAVEAFWSARCTERDFAPRTRAWASFEGIGSATA